MDRRVKIKFHHHRPKGKKDNNPTASGSSSAPPPPWTELPRDVTGNILRRLGPVELLENAQKVCTTWRSVCSEPSLWRVIDMKNSGEVDEKFQSYGIMCRRAVDRSQGELIDINIEYFGTDDLLHYISQRSSRLKSLRLGRCLHISTEGLTASVKHFPELEELHLYSIPFIIARDIEAISNLCPKLKSFTLGNRGGYMFQPVEIDDTYALTIAKNMPNLQHLCLFGNRLSNEGLKAIFYGCPNLETLDLRQCFNLDFRGDFRRICLERIKYLKSPSDSTNDYKWGGMIYDDNDYGGNSFDNHLVGGYEDYLNYESYENCNDYSSRPFNDMAWFRQDRNDYL